MDITVRRGTLRYVHWRLLLGALGIAMVALAASPAVAAPDDGPSGRPTSPAQPGAATSDSQSAAPGDYTVVTFSFDLLLEAVSRSSDHLARQLRQARDAATAARLAKLAATRASVAAASAAASAEEAALTAKLAQAEAQRAQEAVDRWAAAAYRGSALGLLAATITAPGSPADYLHVSGLTMHAADYQAYLVETAHKAALAASLAQADSVAAARRAEEAVSDAITRSQEAELLLAQAQSKVDLAERRLRASKLQIGRLLPGMSLERALGVAREWGDGRLSGLLEQASILKDSRPFAPGSGANSNERLPEWSRWDPRVEPGSPRAYAVFRLAHFGWSVLQWPCLDRMWWHESGWKVQSTDAMQGTSFGELNPNLTWGIPQANPASKMADPAQGGGPDWVTNPMTQINWGLTYIKRVYGSPCQAWDAWRDRAATGRYGWY